MNLGRPRSQACKYESCRDHKFITNPPQILCVASIIYGITSCVRPSLCSIATNIFPTFPLMMGADPYTWTGPHSGPIPTCQSIKHLKTTIQTFDPIQTHHRNLEPTRITTAILIAKIQPWIPHKQIQFALSPPSWLGPIDPHLTVLYLISNPRQRN